MSARLRVAALAGVLVVLLCWCFVVMTVLLPVRDAARAVAAAGRRIRRACHG